MRHTPEQLRLMADNFTRRAEQHDKLGDPKGAATYRRLARQCLDGAQPPQEE